MATPPHFLDVDDLSPTALAEVLELARRRRASPVSPDEDPPLQRRTLGMLFEKPSTRTRVSFETGMTQLGGHAVFLGPDDTQLDRGEPLKDTARALSAYVDAIMARVFDHEHLLELARYATVPVVNGLTDDAHPCQTLADLLTIEDHFDGCEGVRAAWIGDGNNVARSFALGCAMTGIELTIATPPAYGVGEDVLDRAATLGQRPTCTHDPRAAATDADVLYTDVWVSMGEEDARAEKLDAFEGFQLDEALLGPVASDAIVMHCLPANRGEEIADAVLEGDRSVVWGQAENRLHAQKGLLCHLLNDEN